jgi:hypothetical protein
MDGVLVRASLVVLFLLGSNSLVNDGGWFIFYYLPTNNTRATYLSTIYLCIINR